MLNILSTAVSERYLDSVSHRYNLVHGHRWSFLESAGDGRLSLRLRCRLYWL